MTVSGSGIAIKFARWQHTAMRCITGSDNVVRLLDDVRSRGWTSGDRGTRSNSSIVSLVWWRWGHREEECASGDRDDLRNQHWSVLLGYNIGIVAICSRNQVPGPSSKIPYPVPNLGNYYPVFHRDPTKYHRFWPTFSIIKIKFSIILTSLINTFLVIKKSCHIAEQLATVSHKISCKYDICY